MALLGCRPITFRDSEEGRVVAEMGSTNLYLRDVPGLNLDGVTAEDSLLIIESYAKEWIKSRLLEVYSESKYNGYSADIEKRVEEYRKQLYVDIFEAEYTKNENINVSSSEIDKYYKANSSRHTLSHSMVKAKVIVVPETYNDIDVLIKKFRSRSVDEYIDIQSLAHRDGFFEKDMSGGWHPFSDVASYLPFSKSKVEVLLKRNGVHQFKGEGKLYLVDIVDKRLEGSVAPREVSEGMIKSAILLERQNNYIEGVKDSLYNKAIERGKASIKLQ